MTLKKLNPCSPSRNSSLFTTRFGGVATSVIIPLMSPAKLSGIIRRDGDVFIRMETLSTTGIKIATTPVELIKAPSPATVSIRKTSIFVSLLPATLTSQLPTLVATPVRTRPSPIINSAAIRITFGSLKPENASLSVSVSLRTKATITSSAIASMRTFPLAKSTTATARRDNTQISSPFTTYPCLKMEPEFLHKKAPAMRGYIMRSRFKSDIHPTVRQLLNRQAFKAGQHKISFIETGRIRRHIHGDGMTPGGQTGK